MPVAYDPANQLLGFRPFVTGSPILRALRSPLWWLMLLWFAGCLCVTWNVHPTAADQVHSTTSYLVSLLGSLFSFQMTHYISDCGSRRKTSWLAAMKGWSRLNDLGLRCSGHFGSNPKVACEVMRLAHAANQCSPAALEPRLR
jgi:hypothetical protein